MQSSSKKPPVAKPNSVVSSSANKVSYVLCDLLNKLTCHPQEKAGPKNLEEKNGVKNNTGRSTRNNKVRCLYKLVMSLIMYLLSESTFLLIVIMVKTM